MDKTQYQENINLLLQDMSAYQQIQANLTKKLTSQLTVQLLENFRNEGKYTAKTLKMKAREFNIAKFYDLSKLYREDKPLKSIVSPPGSPAYHLSKYLWNQMKHVIKDST